MDTKPIGSLKGRKVSIAKWIPAKHGHGGKYDKENLAYGMVVDVAICHIPEEQSTFMLLILMPDGELREEFTDACTVVEN